MLPLKKDELVDCTVSGRAYDCTSGIDKLLSSRHIIDKIVLSDILALISSPPFLHAPLTVAGRQLRSPARVCVLPIGEQTVLGTFDVLVRK